MQPALRERSVMNRHRSNVHSSASERVCLPPRFLRCCPSAVLNGMRKISPKRGPLSRAAVVAALLATVVFSATSWSQTPASPSDNTPKQEFYSAKDRQTAIKNASIFKAQNVADVDILAGP